LDKGSTNDGIERVAGVVEGAPVIEDDLKFADVNQVFVGAGNDGVEVGGKV
jgi:hypothetical protein